jgi:hypothetical protein
MSKKWKVAIVAANLAASFSSTAFAYAGHDFDRSPAQIDRVAGCEVHAWTLKATECNAATDIPRNDYAY